MRSITIDIWDKLRERISVPQREILGRTLRFTITDRGQPVNLTGSTVTMYAKKPSAAIVFNALTVITAASGIAQIVLTEQMIVEAGTLECSLLIVDSSANETRTQKFDIEVLASDDFTSSVESSSEYNAFSTALSTYSGIDTRTTDLEIATTAANLLTAIKTVDGAGSGLDADTLDSKSSTEFCFTNEISTPDSVTQSGIYKVITAFTGVMIHLQYDENYAVQIRHATGGVIEYRLKWTGAWGAWGAV